MWSWNQSSNLPIPLFETTHWALLLVHPWPVGLYFSSSPSLIVPVWKSTICYLLCFHYCKAHSSRHLWLLHWVLCCCCSHHISMHLYKWKFYLSLVDLLVLSNIILCAVEVLWNRIQPSFGYSEMDCSVWGSSRSVSFLSSSRWSTKIFVKYRSIISRQC